MIEKELGKIDFAEYGTIKDYPFLVGLQLYFHLGNGCSIGDGGKYTVNLSDGCKWKNSDERNIAIAESVDFTNQLLEDAKVSYISELVGKPVEVTIENNIFKDFRILTEVL